MTHNGGGRFNAAKPLLCSRCGFLAEIQSEQGVFNLFLCGVANIILSENQ